MTACRRCLPARLLLPAALLLGLLAAAAPAHAAIPWAPCATAGYECAHVDVPLDRTGAVPGSVSLAVARVPAASNPNRTAVVALAGGPGQAALPLTEDFARVLAPEIASRDLLVYDQRGTGSSNPLDCSALHQLGTLSRAAAKCARELGVVRGSYRTPDSVEDIEALRVAGGYDKLVLFGVSYGTKVALAYAAAHPANVEALILDSVVLPEGPDPFQRSTLTSAPRVLRELCAGSACASATPDVTGDLTTLARRLRASPLRGKLVTTSGKRVNFGVDQTGLVDILLAGDLNPTLRAELPGSMRAALRGDPAPLLRLSARSEGLTTGLQSAGGDSSALYLATTCEEAGFPWTRTAGPAQRQREITAAAGQIPREQFGPFSPRAALQAPAIQLCLGWPDQSAPPGELSPLPQVPTLVLDGQMDLRTPLEDAAQLTSRIPGAAVVEVPYTGHSVLGTDASTCAKDALAAFADGRTPGACPATTNPFSPTPRPPTTLAAIKAKGRVRKTIVAAAATVTDARRQIIGDALAIGSSPSRVAGLRGGYATVAGGGFRLKDYQYVPGVVVSGTSGSSGASKVSIHGAGTAPGTLTITAGGAVRGNLGGQKVDIAASTAVRDRLPSLKRVLAAPRLAR
jgi:pimeloyl-ACP methyl ester carboxylesterase